MTNFQTAKPAIIKPQMFSATLTERIQLTHNVIELEFALVEPSAITFQAGQFANIRIDDGNPKILFRSYSIMSPPHEPQRIKTCVKIIEGGRATQWLNNIPIGTAITFMAPFGKFVFNETRGDRGTPAASEKNALFIATGTGITPLRCMILEQLEKGNRHPMHLLWGFRHNEDVFYREWLQELAQEFPNFSYTITLSQPLSPWNGEVGRVTDWLTKNLHSEDARNTHVYICGVGDMVLDVAKLCEEKGIAHEDVHFERYD